MRFKSTKTDGFQVYAVSGVNTISFAIDFTDGNTKNLLGFAVERHDLKNDEKYFMRGFKVFKEIIPHPDNNTVVSTFDHPIQSFVWDDFTTKPDNTYEYSFYPIKGQPKKLDRYSKKMTIKVQTEKLYDDKSAHDIFFNRGVASSQAYSREFHNQKPDEIKDPKERERAFAWLGRDLPTAIEKFISQAKKGDTLIGCFYEFRYLPIALALKKAIDGGVDVQIIIDAKINKHKVKGKMVESFPREENLRIIKQAKIPKGNIIKREANKSKIQHNKFIVLLKGLSQTPIAVWTGSTNISEGGIFGQTNVGHWVRDKGIAAKYKGYWDILSKDPGTGLNDDRTISIKKNTKFKKEVIALQKDIKVKFNKNIPVGITPIFSPRRNITMLESYGALLDGATKFSAVTLAFGVNTIFKKLLSKRTANSHLTFMLLEKKDAPSKKNKKKFTYLTAKNNVYEAWGAFLKDPVYQFTKEVSTRGLKLNQHVAYIHSKFLLSDPLSDDPIVVTGSANFSDASTVNNDENMIIIRGSLRVADIYFTEFNRLFNHYYFRSVYEDLHKDETNDAKTKGSGESLFLLPNDKWLDKYKKGKLRYKRVKLYSSMLNTIILK
jgi:phosphatidylserine/phosphatidylglycerophosphate/cardiolipin synthase-like enzyme